MSGATPTNYKQKLRGQDPRLRLTSLIQQQVSLQPTSPSLTTPTALSSWTATSTASSPATASSASTAPSTSTTSAHSTASSSSTTSTAAPATAPSSSLLPQEQRYQLDMALPQIKLRPFTGQEDAMCWWQELQNFVGLLNYREDRQCLLVPFYLEGGAKLWYQDLPEDTQKNLELLKAAFLARFTKPKTFDVNLLQMTQSTGESISGFITRLQYATHNLQLPASVIVAVAVNGLQPSIRQWVMNKEPTTLEQVQHHAELAEKSQCGARSTEVNMALKVDQLSELVATLITKTETPAVQAASKPPQQPRQRPPRRQHPHQSNGQQQYQVPPPPTKPSYYQASPLPPSQIPRVPPTLSDAATTTSISATSDCSASISVTSGQYGSTERRQQFPVPPFLQDKCLGCGMYCSDRLYCPHLHTRCTYCQKVGHYSAVCMRAYYSQNAYSKQ